MKVKKSSAYALHALMYMVRHSTQLPATTATIAKAEGIPSEYLAKIFQQLVKASFVKAVAGRKKGYIFSRPPEEISLLELFETIEGCRLFDECFLKQCDGSGTTENGSISEIWYNATRQINNLLKETSVASAAWKHPQHRFLSLPISLANPKKKRKTKLINFETTASIDKTL